MVTAAVARGELLLKIAEQIESLPDGAWDIIEAMFPSIFNMFNNPGAVKLAAIILDNRETRAVFLEIVKRCWPESQLLEILASIGQGQELAVH